MIQRLYIDNYKCFQNFELQTEGQNSLLLLGKNGTGKSTIGEVLQIFQSIGRGQNRLGELFGRQNLQSASPIRLELEVFLGNDRFVYTIAIELPENFQEYRIFQEKLLVNNEIVFTRNKADITFHYQSKQDPVGFAIDWHLAALPVIREGGKQDVVKHFCSYLGRMVILKPIPQLIMGEWQKAVIHPLPTGENLGAWLSALLLQNPAAYTFISDFLKELMPDFASLENSKPEGEGLPNEESERRVWQICFQSETEKKFKVSLGSLSDGEKCFLLCALLLAANEIDGPIFCFWDEPDNFLSIDEVGQFVLHLRRAFQKTGQFWASSHNPEAIRQFADENTYYLSRTSHIEPVRVRPLGELHSKGELSAALLTGSLSQ